MKKKNQSHRQDFLMPHLFREDLEEIEEILKESDPENLKFETNDFEYGSVKEIPEKDKRLDYFHIQIYRPYISIDFSKTSAYIYASEKDIKSLGIAGKIADVVKKRERKFLFYIRSFSGIFSGILFGIPFFFMLINFDISKRLAIILLFLLFGGIVSIILFTNNIPRYSIIELYYKKDKPSFFVKNRDQIILITFGTILGAIATLFLQKIFS